MDIKKLIARRDDLKERLVKAREAYGAASARDMDARRSDLLGLKEEYQVVCVQIERAGS